MVFTFLSVLSNCVLEPCSVFKGILVLFSVFQGVLVLFQVVSLEPNPRRSHREALVRPEVLLPGHVVPEPGEARGLVRHLAKHGERVSDLNALFRFFFSVF